MPTLLIHTKVNPELIKVVRSSFHTLTIALLLSVTTRQIQSLFSTSLSHPQHHQTHRDRYSRTKQQCLQNLLANDSSTLMMNV